MKMKTENNHSHSEFAENKNNVKTSIEKNKKTYNFSGTRYTNSFILNIVLI